RSDGGGAGRTCAAALRTASWREPLGGPIPEIAAISAATRTNSDRNIGLSRRRALSFPSDSGASANRSGRIRARASSMCRAQVPTVAEEEEEAAAAAEVAGAAAPAEAGVAAVRAAGVAAVRAAEAVAE